MCGSKEVENRTLAEVGVPCLVQPYCVSYSDPYMKKTIEALKQRADRDADRDAAETMLATVRKLFADARPGFDFNWVKRPRLDVTREYVLPGAQMEFDGTPPVYGGWRNGCAWFVFGNRIYSLNPDTQKVEYGPVPFVRRRNTTTTAYGTRLAVTDDYLVYCFMTRQFFPVKNFSCDIAVRRRDKGDWVTNHLPFVAKSPVQVGGKLYALIEAPDALQTGLVSFDSATLKCDILRDPGARRVEPHAKTGTADFAALSFEFPLLATTHELVGSWNRLSYGWNPLTGAVRSISTGEAKALYEATMPYFRVCESFHFSEFDASADTSSDHLACRGHPGRMYLLPKGAKQRIQIEIRTPRTVRGGSMRGPMEMLLIHESNVSSDMDMWESLPTQHSLLVPYASERGFCEIPYADIRAWLASNYTGFAVEPAKSQPGGK
jgi:hypothetical protein